jgi:hypothetical protein
VLTNRSIRAPSKTLVAELDPFHSEFWGGLIAVLLKDMIKPAWHDFVPADEVINGGIYWEVA